MELEEGTLSLKSKLIIMNWYEKLIPNVSDKKEEVSGICENISNIPECEAVYIWGSFAENFKNKTAFVREAEILIKCNFDSGDLLAIDKSSSGPFGIPNEELEDMGFNPKAVSFTRKAIKMVQPYMEIWALSRDNKLLHWGPISDTVEEWKNLRKEAEIHASNELNLNKTALKKANREEVQQWMSEYQCFIRKEIESRSPVGWYESKFKDIDEVLSSCIKI